MAESDFDPFDRRRIDELLRQSDEDATRTRISVMMAYFNRPRMVTPRPFTMPEKTKKR